MKDVLLYPLLEIGTCSRSRVRCRYVFYGSDGNKLSYGPWMTVFPGQSLRLHPLSYALTPTSMLESVNAPDVCNLQPDGTSAGLATFASAPDWFRRLIPPYDGN